MDQGIMKHVPDIFISMASYRDPELIPTLHNMLEQAAHPENLHIAISWQDDEDLSVFERAGLKPDGIRSVAGRQINAFRYFGTRVDIINLHYYQSQGACWARNLAETLFEGEAYFLQIDSHCRFVPNWDSEMIAMLSQLQRKTAKPIISSYPPPFTPGEDEEASKKRYVSRLTFREFSQEGLPMLSSVPFTSEEPVPGSYLAGGFIFSTGDFIKQVPNDPHIFFAGEEIAMAVRAFTHGYDIFHPHKILLWHYYQRQECRKVWGDHTNEAKAEGTIAKAWWEWDKVSKLRVRTLLGLEETSHEALAPWALGHERTLRQFEYQAGIYLKNGTVLPEVMAPEHKTFFSEWPADEAQWLERQFAYHKKTLTLSKAEYDTRDPAFESLHVSVYTPQNVLLYKKTLASSELETLRANSNNDDIAISFEFKTHAAATPKFVRICPWSADSGWGTVTEKTW